PPTSAPSLPDALPICKCPPSGFVQRLEGAVARGWFVDPSGEPRRNQRDHDRHEVDRALVADDVRVVAVVDEARAGLNDVGRAGGDRKSTRLNSSHGSI